MEELDKNFGKIGLLYHMAKESKQKDTIKQLEQKLADKTAELDVFKSEVSKLNKNIQVLITKIQDQIQIAHKIQGILLPTEIPNIPGFEFSTKFQPSYESGGDYYDMFELEDKFRFSILLASSSGHGISSLFLSVLLKLTGQIEARKGTPPDKVIKSIANEIAPDAKDNEYANIFYAIIDRRNFEITFCNTGKNLAFLYKHTDKEIEILASETDPITSKNDVMVQNHTAALNPRDCLVFVTEGVSQAKNDQGEIFGISRIEKLIYEKAQSSPHEIRNEIFYQLQKFTGKKELSKDATVIVAEVKDRVLKLAK